MAWAQGDLTSSLSIVIALAACLSATTSEGRTWGGPGAVGQRLGGMYGCGFGCVSGVCCQEDLTLLVLASPRSREQSSGLLPA